MTVSLCVVAYNEEEYLPDLLKDLVSQTFPKELTEIVLVDGLSTDHTKDLMLEFKDYQSGWLGIKVLDNPKRIQAAGWNIAIQEASGDVIIRIDAHTQIPVEFVEKNMKLQSEGEFITGGLRQCKIKNPSVWRKMLLEVENSLFGSSVNKTRRSQKKNYVKTMFHAAYRREVFDRVGLFNENLLRTEDNEIHYRIRSADYKLCYDPNIISFQYARSTLKNMIKQKYANGFWIGITARYNFRIISVYHVIPFLFLLGILGSTFLLTLGYWQPLTLIGASYLFFVVLEMGKSLISKRTGVLTILFPLIFLVLHLAYGIGTLIGLLKAQGIIREFE